MKEKDIHYSIKGIYESGWMCFSNKGRKSFDDPLERVRIYENQLTYTLLTQAT